MDIDGATLFIAGGTSAAGAAVIKTLLERFPNVRINCAWMTQPPFIDDARVTPIQVDLRNPVDCSAAVRGSDIAVMTAASSGGIAVHLKKPWTLVNDNLFMNAAMLAAFHEHRLQRVVFVGSSTVYQPMDGWLSEEDLDFNRDPAKAYMGVGWCMRYIEKLCSFWNLNSDMRVSIVRAANIYGPYSRFDPETANVVPALIRKAVDRMDPFEVLGAPGITRDLLYSEDFAEAIVMLLENETAARSVLNLGSGRAVSVGEIVSHVLAAAGHTPSKISWAQPEMVSAPMRVLDTNRALRVIGWRATTPPADGIANTLNWWRENCHWWSK